MGTRSLQASKVGIEKAKVALAQYSLSQNSLAEDLGLSRQTVNNFFKGKPIDRENFALICERLGLDIENTVVIAPSPETSKPINKAELDVLVQNIRQKIHTDIQTRCGEMRVLDMTRPIGLDTIYTDVNILQTITGRQRLSQDELLAICNLEDFDRLGFAPAHTGRRPGLEVVEQFDKLMLLGKPGAGKTTFLKRLATLCNAGLFQQHRVPIFITLKDFGDSSEQANLLTYIYKWLHELGVKESQSSELLDKGRGFLLLDGLDEVSEGISKKVLQEIQKFSHRFSRNAFVLSCRIAAKEFTFQQFTEVEVADFNDEQIADFASRWFQAKQVAEKTEHFLAKLQDHPRIRELATNPLLLTLLCLVFEGRTDFPANRPELYKEGLDVLLKKWDGTRSIEREQIYRELSLKRKEDLLSQLAFTTFELGNYFFKQKDAERLVETYIQNLPRAQTDPEALRLDSEAVLKSIEAQHGLLVERARGIYSFSHLTFHEYFTARRIEKRDELHQVLISHLAEKRWREVLLLTVGMMEVADSLLLAMKSQIDGMLKMDDKLQQFLTWINQKTCSTNAPFKPIAIRAFYFAIDQDLNYAINRDIDIARNDDLSINRNFAIDIARDLDLNLARALDCKLNRAIDLDLARDLDLDLARNLALANSLDLDLYYAYAPTDRNYAYAIAIAIDHALTCNRALARDPDFKQSLQKLKDQLPEPEKNWDYFKQWWQIHNLDWIAKLRTVLIKHRNIGHNWQFSNTQKEQLRQYYNANQLLVECLNSDCYVSREVRAEIEETLLLPVNPQEYQAEG